MAVAYIIRPSKFAPTAFVVGGGVALTAAWLSGVLPTGAPTPVQVIGAGLAFTTITLGGRACLWVIVVLAVLAPTATIATLGPFQLRAWDPFYLGLLAFAVADPTARGRTQWLRPVATFLFFAGLTVVWVWYVDPGTLSHSAISWLRLVQTLSLAWLIPRCIRDARDVRRLMSLLLAAGVVAVVLVTGNSGLTTTALTTGRDAYVFNANTFGMVSGLLIVSFLWKEGRGLISRTFVAAAGVLGLLLSKSVGSLIAVVVATGLLVLWRNKGKLGGVKTLLVLAVLGAVALSAVRVGRPEVLPSASSFSTSSASQRIIFAKAGIAEFVHHPLIGVGWQRSNVPEVMQSPEVLPWLGGTQSIALAFDTSVAPSVHNAYIQVIAETGVLGVLLFLRALWLGARSVRPRLTHPLVAFIAAQIAFVLTWWNDNPIYGSQTETLVLAVLLGALTVVVSSWELAPPPPLPNQISLHQ